MLVSVKAKPCGHELALRTLTATARGGLACYQVGSGGMVSLPVSPEEWVFLKVANLSGLQLHPYSEAFRSPQALLQPISGSFPHPAPDPPTSSRLRGSADSLPEGSTHRVAPYTREINRTLILVRHNRADI